MAKRNALNKSSTYIESFVDFILDTKPYHSKLTQVIEEYHFSDKMHVNIEERFINRAKLDSTWMYNFYSSASPFQRTMPLHRVINPSFQLSSHRVGVDENTDMALVPYVYSKKAFDNNGINAAYIHRARGTNEPLTESVDYFTSHGAFQFQIKQTKDASDNFAPLWTASNDESVIAHATAATQRKALDQNNPNSAINQVRNLMNEIALAYLEHNDVLVELEAIRNILDIPSLPQTYENLFALMDSHPDITFDIESAKTKVQNLSSPLFFNIYTDLGMRESGLAAYRDVENDSIRVYDIEPSHELPAYEEWTLSVFEKETNTWRLTGSVSGFIGLVQAGLPFTSNPKIRFSTVAKAPPEDDTEVLSIVPTRKLVIHKDAPLETWNLIKVNSIAHTRASYRSDHYGLIKDLDGEFGDITIVDQTMPTTTIILDARDDGVSFDITNTEFPQHQGVATADVPYNDGYIGFTIVTGAAPFQLGDRYVIQIVNVKARSVGFEVGFGYDLDAYDNDNLVYNNTDPDSPDYNKKIGFYYDGRFNDYDVSLLNLEIREQAINNRRFRLRALPSSVPIATIKRDGSGPNNQVDLYDATSGIPPDPELNGVPVYSMEDDANPDPDLLLYYATEFAFEYSDDDFSTVHFVENIAVGTSYDSWELGVKFDFLEGSKPFIAASSDNGPGPRVIGGDILSFVIDNPLPYVANKPILFISPILPRLLMHSDSFYDVKGGKWEVRITSPSAYTVTGYDNAGELIGTANGVMTTPGLGPIEGNSFKGLGVHFTIVPNKGGVFTGDVFKFETFDRKPSYLVHGSVTGWTAPAVIGEFYWNGKIGFTIKKPEIVLYLANLEAPALENGFDIQRLRDDTPSLSYILDKTSNGYMVSRTDVGVKKFLAPLGTYEDKYIRFKLTADLDSEQENFILDVNGSDFPLFHAHDTIIVKSEEMPMPVVGDHIIIEKTRQDRLGISITTSKTSLIPLKPITIDQRLIDIDSRNALYPLELTSPDAIILNGWLPTFIEPMDSLTSVAEFSDPATRYEVRSAANGMKIGAVRQQTTDIDSPIVFEWDDTFYNTYLPLNAEANLTTTTSGWNDLTKINITESVKFLIGGGALLENFLFKEDIRVSMTTNFELKINTQYADSFSTVVRDNNFEGFLRGFGNTGYDGTTYDEGRSPDLHSVLANVNMSEEQRAGYLRQWDFYLNSPEVPTTEEQWAYVREMFGLDPNPGYDSTDDFGFPAQGLGLDIVDDGLDTAGPRFQEAFVTVIKEAANLHDANKYDSGRLDQQSNEIVVMLSASLPPVPFDMPSGTTYATLDTPLATALPARHFEIMFTGTNDELAGLNPVFRIWLPDATEPQFVPPVVVEKLGAGKYKFTIPQASEAKILVG